MRVAEQYEQVSQRKLPVQTVRETLVELFREAYGESVPRATVREFIATWLKKQGSGSSAGDPGFLPQEYNEISSVLGPRGRARSSERHPPDDR